jgi:AcrR family transcriptional regulator
MSDDGPAAPKVKFFPWATAGERDRAARVALSRDQIVEAAIRVLDAEGLDALSMRRLGQELDAGATSLYWHIRNKDELLDLVLDRIIGEALPEFTPGMGWREISVVAARALRRVLVAHRGVAPVMGERPTFGPNAVQALELILTSFVDAGFGPEDALLASTTVINWASGFAVFEVRDPMGPGATPAERKAFLAEFYDFLASLPADRYPTTMRLLPYGPGLDPDRQFEYGLQRMLDGIEASLAKGR